MTIDVKRLYDYWYREADYSWEIAKTLFEKRKYPECLFFCHLALEKLLKAIIVVKTKQHASPIHDLAGLAKKGEWGASKEQLDELKIYNEFCIAGRYDEEKMTFRKKCTKKFTDEHFYKIQKLFLWLKEEAKRYQPR